MQQLLNAIILITLTTMVCAPQISLASEGPSPDQTTGDTIELAPIDQWNVGIALGYGKIENVILDQSDLTIYAVPTLSYYGKNLFFDNGTLGYSIADKPNYTVSLVSEVNPYSAQFYDYHPINVFLLDSAQSSSVNQDAEAAQSPNEQIPNNPSAALGDEVDFVDDIFTEITGPVTKQRDPIVLTKPDWNIDIGLQHNWFVSNRSSLVTQIFTDVSQLHSGHRATLTWSSQFRSPLNWGWLGGIKTNLQIGLSYLDAKTTQYFYGIDERHTSDSLSHYTTSNAFNTSLSVSAKKSFNENLSAIAYWKSMSLDQSLYQSPRIDERYANTYFVGLIYEF